MDSTAMSWREHIRQNMRLALPLMIGQLATIGIWTSDTIAMGWIDSSSLAAGALASRFYQPFFFLALGISLAVGPLVAQGIGAGDERQVRRAFRQGMVIAVALGLVTAPLLLFGEQVLVLLGQDPELAAIGQPFLFWSSFGLPFMFLSVVLRQFLISHQRPMPQVIALIIALAANVALNEAFVSGIGPFPAMGLAGIALATTIVYALLCAGLIAYIAMIQPFRDSRPFQRLWVMDWAVTARLLRIGVPIGLTIVAEAGMFIAVTFLIGLFGTGEHRQGRQFRRRRRPRQPVAKRRRHLLDRYRRDRRDHGNSADLAGVPDRAVPDRQGRHVCRGDGPRPADAAADRPVPDPRRGAGDRHVGSSRGERHPHTCHRRHHQFLDFGRRRRRACRIFPWLRPDRRLGRAAAWTQRGLADPDHAHDAGDAAHPRRRPDPAGLGRASRIWTPGFHSL